MCTLLLILIVELNMTNSFVKVQQYLQRTGNLVMYLEYRPGPKHEIEKFFRKDKLSYSLNSFYVSAADHQLFVGKLTPAEEVLC